MGQEVLGRIHAASTPRAPHWQEAPAADWVLALVNFSRHYGGAHIISGLVVTKLSPSTFRLELVTSSETMAYLG
jgi:hypothetical protein